MFDSWIVDYKKNIIFKRTVVTTISMSALDFVPSIDKINRQRDILNILKSEVLS